MVANSLPLGPPYVQARLQVHVRELLAAGAWGTPGSSTASDQQPPTNNPTYLLHCRTGAGQVLPGKAGRDTGGSLAPPTDGLAGAGTPPAAVW